MMTSRSKVLCHNHPMTPGLFLFATLLGLLLLIPHIEAAGADTSGCPRLSQGASKGCPYKGGAKGAGCLCMKGSKVCLHALKGDLQLSEEQVNRIKEIREQYVKDSAELRAMVQKKKEELDRLFRDPDAAADEIIAGRKALSALKEQLWTMSMDFRLEIRAELKSDQIRKLPAGSWRGILPSARDCKCSRHPGPGHPCPYKKAPSEDAST